jgi:hypothetical protein
MAEYIDREALFAEFDRLGLGEHSIVEKVFSLGVRTIIAGMPAADVAQVVHGRWGTCRVNLETGNYEEQCTRCRNFSKEYGKPYCPNCGAKMDGGE